MNVLLLVVDSLRAGALNPACIGRPSTPFFDSLGDRGIVFRRAYATECWTLPTHASMFTGLLPSEHGAHFQTMEYAGAAPTIAEILGKWGYETEVATRNPVFDGGVPGITRGFRTRTLVLSERSRGLNPLAVMLALSKPRFRRQVRSSGFFHPLQREHREFVQTFARSTVPADRELLDHVLERMQDHRRHSRRYFLFANLFDVHAPYPPVPASIFRSWRTLDGALENLTMPFVLPSLGGHEYLRPGFRLSDRSRRYLLGRYHDAVALTDAKLASFFAETDRLGLLDDTLLILTSDHGEAFGEHGLYLHDASVYETHLHVPLFIRHPGRAPEYVDDVVSTRDLFGVMRAAGDGNEFAGTLLDPMYREGHPVALAEHHYYPHAAHMAPRYRTNLRAAVTAHHKAIARPGEVSLYELTRDPDERQAGRGTIGDFLRSCERDGLEVPARTAAGRHLQGALR